MRTSFLYRTCVRRAPSLRALYKLVVLLLPENVTGVRPRWRTTPSEHFLHTSHHALHALALHTPQLISSQIIWFLRTSRHLFDLFSPHPILSHMSSKQILLNCFHLIRALKKVHLNSSQLFCTMWRWRWEDVKMRRCEDEKTWWQTSTIRRTLCSDALGKNVFFWKMLFRLSFWCLHFRVFFLLHVSRFSSFPAAAKGPETPECVNRQARIIVSVLVT